MKLWLWIRFNRVKECSSIAKCRFKKLEKTDYFLCGQCKINGVMTIVADAGNKFNFKCPVCGMSTSLQNSHGDSFLVEDHFDDNIYFNNIIKKTEEAKFHTKSHEKAYKYAREKCIREGKCISFLNNFYS